MLTCRNTSKAKYCVLRNGVFIYTERNAFQLETEWRLVIDWFVMRSVGVGRLATRQRVSQRLFIVTTLLEREKDAAEKYSRRLVIGWFVTRSVEKYW